MQSCLASFLTYTSRVEMPADLALLSVVHTEESTEPVDLKPRGMIKPMPLDLKHDAVEEPTAAET